ncbi:MAG: M20 family metallopeptidase [Prolixibacteraceae bacterium]
MQARDVILLTRKLLSLNTINPPGNEKPAALTAGRLLEENGFYVRYIPFETDRLQVIAEKGCDDTSFPVVFTGHFDTVPLGAKAWSVDPFAGEINGDRLFGRGASDMKGGLAAMIIAAICAFKEGSPAGGVRLVLTAGEELGCHGAKGLLENKVDLGKARGIIVGEPTSNVPAIGHKGGLYLNLTATGITAHSSMPHLGENAIYKIARAILKAERFDFGVEADPLLGMPTINVGKVSGGMNINSVPDRAGFTIDARTTAKVDHQILLKQLQQELGNGISIDVLVNLKAVSNNENDHFVRSVYDACGIGQNSDGYPKALPYLTDGSVLQPLLGGAPTVILGPGEPEMAHQTDEFCYVSKLKEAMKIYKKIILNDANQYDRVS